MRNRNKKDKPCLVQSAYSELKPAYELYSNRDKLRSFMIGSVLRPESRAINTLAFLDMEHSAGNFLNALQGDTFVSYGRGGYMLQYLSMKPIPDFSTWSKTYP